MKSEHLVSIIMPNYNGEAYLQNAIDSVIFQTYLNWELLIIDDCSTDGSVAIIKSNCSKDSRLRFFKTDKPSGSPTVPRNIGIRNAKGRFIAFLDSDDLWFPNKLKLQLPLLLENNVAISFSNYEKMSEDGYKSNRVIISSSIHSYRSLRYGNELGCLTVIVDILKTGIFQFPNIGHEDYALWLSILKQGFIAKNCNAVTAAYRIRSSSISSNKLKAIKWVWTIYRKHEGFSYIQASYYLLFAMFKSIVKYFK